MKITICCSLVFMEQAFDVKNQLDDLGHEVFIPETFNHAATNDVSDAKSIEAGTSDEDFVEFKASRMRLHFDKIKSSDAILVINEKKKDVENYIGGNTLVEMGVAFFLQKPIFLMNPIPLELNYAEEIRGMEPVVINQELSKLL